MLFSSFFSYFVCFYILDSVNLNNSNFKFLEPALSNCLSHLMLIKSIYLHNCNNDVSLMLFYFLKLFVNPPTWLMKINFNYSQHYRTVLRMSMNAHEWSIGISSNKQHIETIINSFDHSRWKRNAKNNNKQTNKDRKEQGEQKL